ncbi:hypothetical protein [Nitratireductor sp. L15S-10]|uniref:hypothetical protein n=1 Tax=Nitratireductor sp. L15S-10 TaxID=3034028 RepID=UPI0038571F72
MRKTSLPQFLRSACLSAIWSLGALSAASAEPERITFAHKNWSDLRGILNVFETLRSACLTQPVTQELPAQLLPEGYQIVSSDLYALGFEAGSKPKAVVLSKNGEEARDLAEGEPYVELTFATDATPSGGCRVTWSRDWDYSEGVNGVMNSMAVLFDPWFSYSLRAVRASRPDEGFTPQDQYSQVSEWAAPCFDGQWCRVGAILELRRDKGVRLTITRGEEPVGARNDN